MILYLRESEVNLTLVFGNGASPIVFSEFGSMPVIDLHLEKALFPIDSNLMGKFFISNDLHSLKAHCSIE